MKKIFHDPKVRGKVILTDSKGQESTQRIVEVTPKAIRVSSCNLYRFSRTGLINKKCARDWAFTMSIRPA